MKNAYAALTTTQRAAVLSNNVFSASIKQSLSSVDALVKQGKIVTNSRLQEAVATTKLTSIKKKEIAVTLGLVDSSRDFVAASKEKIEAKLEEAVADNKLTPQEQEHILASLAATNANKKLAWSFSALTASIKASIVAFATSPLGMFALFTAGAYAAYRAIKYANEQTERYREELDELKSTLSETASSIESLNSELENNRNRISEIQSNNLQAISNASRKEIEQLETTNKQLERKLALLEAVQAIQQKEVNRQFLKTMESSDRLSYADTSVTHKDSAPAVGVRSSVEAQFEKLKALQAELAAKEQEYADALVYGEATKGILEQKELIERQILAIQSELTDYFSQWQTDAENVEYINNPTTDDEKAVNAWLDLLDQLGAKFVEISDYTVPTITPIDYEKARGILQTRVAQDRGRGEWGSTAFADEDKTAIIDWVNSLPDIEVGLLVKEKDIGGLSLEELQALLNKLRNTPEYIIGVQLHV